MPNTLPPEQRVAGVKQTGRAIASGQAKAVYLAGDAEPRMTGQIRAQAEEAGIPVYDVPTMKELGSQCGIPVGAAVAAALKD